MPVTFIIYICDVTESFPILLKPLKLKLTTGDILPILKTTSLVFHKIRLIVP